ncbi:hypothetical protein P3388_26210, partial [Vibrio parahaemolyticus]|nr:hypothetical protein [Vibrio parahaemolyticus]
LSCSSPPSLPLHTCHQSAYQELTCLLTIQTPVQLPVFVKSSISLSGNYSEAVYTYTVILINGDIFLSKNSGQSGDFGKLRLRVCM